MAAPGHDTDEIASNSVGKMAAPGHDTDEGHDTDDIASASNSMSQIAAPDHVTDETAIPLSCVKTEDVAEAEDVH